ncbi:E3 ubiquitin-protein ligase znrf1 [Liparis tanakae]|uniref:E3 ubiquitin-protein ligase znrf1 n=1 Tax=Liparis tanakae TaxID=230148 RepID=A0A4Z2DZM7_9TELE|nr:E3 ubiquitin-protein ligase znrf1 [Liparis tanakae]
MEVHFIMCLSKPRLSYNGKVGSALALKVFVSKSS